MGKGVLDSARMENVTAHILAFIVTAGFFLLCVTALLGWADVSNPTVAGIVGTGMGYAATNVQQVLARYFGPPPEEAQQPPEQEK